MQVSTILENIDLGAVALPEFQRGYVWTRKQVRSFMQSLYRKHPVGSLLVWGTQSDSELARGDGALQPGHVKLLLDGQQRITTLYGIIKGQPPKFFDGDPKAFTDLMFHLEDETFEFYGPVKMRDDARWINVTDLMQADGLDSFIEMMQTNDQLMPHLGRYMSRLNRITTIKERTFHIEEISGLHLDDVVEIFNNVNSGGTKLSKGDLALAKICAGWTDAREEMRNMLTRWEQAGYGFKLDWLLRNVTTILTDQAMFHELDDYDSDEFREALYRAEKYVNYTLNMVSGRLGLDHDRVLGGRYAFPVITAYIHHRGGRIATAAERDKLLYWYLQSFLWGHFSGSTESKLNQDLRAFLEAKPGGELDELIEQLRRWRGSLEVRPEDFRAWGRGSRFYPFLYLLTRVGDAVDWGTGLPLKESMLGKQSSLQVHHIFPRALMYSEPYEYSLAQVNALGNFCFLTQDTNLQISDTSPEIYFPQIAERHPGALESQWIPMDETLWKPENFLEFLESRQALLAEVANDFLNGLLGTEITAELPEEPEAYERVIVVGGIESDEEEIALRECNNWVIRMGLAEGEIGYELTNEDGELLAIIDLAWPEGVQEGLSEPVAVLINEPDETEDRLNHAGYRYFLSIDSFKQYINEEILGVTDPVPGD